MKTDLQRDNNILTFPVCNTTNMAEKPLIEFAPLRIPFERRLQTLAVLWYTAVFFFLPFICALVCFICLFTSYYWITVGYVIWLTFDVAMLQTSSRGGRRSDWLRGSKFTHYFRDYFPVSLIKTADLDPSKNYVFGCHPHGLLSCGNFCNFGTEATGFSKKFPGITPHLLTLKMNFCCPILRGYLLWMGLCDVSKQSIQWILQKKGTGNAAIIVIGGAEEALDANPGDYTITLKKRQGFVKLALASGASLVPVFSFGENDLYYQIVDSTLRRVQQVMKKLSGVGMALFHGRGIFNYTFGFMPFRRPIHTIVGRPIHVGKVAEVTKELVDEVHQRYMDELSSLFDEHKSKYGISEDIKLTFV